jgi:predicted transcriptional regulator
MESNGGAVMERKTDQWTISLPPTLSREALKLAKRESRTRSELVRQALRSYIERQKKLWDARLQFAKNLDKAGIRTLEDVERMVDEGRQ